jgi:hypothetical protein
MSSIHPAATYTDQSRAVIQRQVAATQLGTAQAGTAQAAVTVDLAPSGAGKLKALAERLSKTRRRSRGRWVGPILEWGKMGQNSLYDSGLDQLDFLADRACAGRIWLLPSQSLRAMELAQISQRGSRRGS